LQSLAFLVLFHLIDARSGQPRRQLQWNLSLLNQAIGDLQKQRLDVEPALEKRP
jgi:hypothetical protein